MKHYFDILYPDGHFHFNIFRHLNGNAENPYDDLDSIKNGIYVCKEFYVDLCNYLSKKAYEYNMSISFEMDAENSVPGIVFKDGVNSFPLKSDQLAFSFWGTASKDNKHPYGILYNNTKDVGDYVFIAECLYDTRTLGCSFLWPMVSDENGLWNSNPKYNTDRGIRCYIEDRVDLTLWEIKEAYDYLQNGTNYQGNKLISEIKNNRNMKIWLNLFGSFEKYVDYFSFKTYVVDVDGEYIPIDIVASDVKNNLIKKLTHNHVKELREFKNYGKTKEIQSLKSSEELKRVLENVRLLTLCRSREMEDIYSHSDSVQALLR